MDGTIKISSVRGNSSMNASNPYAMIDSAGSATVPGGSANINVINF